MNLSTEENHHLYMIGLDPSDHPWERAKDPEIKLSMVSSGTPNDKEKRIQQFAFDLLEQKGVSSSVREAIRHDPTSQLRIRRIVSDNYELNVEYQEKEADLVRNVRDTWDAATYLEFAHFTNENDAIKKRLMETIGVSLNDMKEDMLEALAPLREKRGRCTAEKKKEWLTCSGGCEVAAIRAIQQESNSTAYILRCLSSSLLSLEGGRRMEFELIDRTPLELTGRWEKDAPFLRLVDYGAPSNDQHGRLVMGFGPSASGKTHLAKLLLNQLRKTDTTLPPCFISIDGDIYRESSKTYTMVTQVADEICAEGFENLVSSGMKEMLGSLFDTGKIKEEIDTFLTAQQKNLPLSLYVPETLGNCFILCNRKYNKYIELTGDKDKWIGLLIWQHKKGEDCHFPMGFRCKGCTASGEARQKKNGKKYSNSAWENSMKNGKAEFIKAPGGSYIIHNSGQEGSTSVLLDRSNHVSKETKEVFLSAGAPWVYVNDADAQQELTMFSQHVEKFYEQITEFQKKKLQDSAERNALQIIYEDLHSRFVRQSYRIHNALYPESPEIKKINDNMAEINALKSTFIEDLSEWENKHETLTVKVLYIRHGYSCANAARNEQSKIAKKLSLHALISDPSLHPQGIQQALALGEDFRPFVANQGLDIIFTSQLYRAIQTGLLLRHRIVQDKDKTVIPLHIVPYIVEVARSRDNRPSKLTDYTDEQIDLIRADGPVKIDRERRMFYNSDISAFVNGSLRAWLSEQHNVNPSKKEYHVAVVTHSTLLNNTFGRKLNNCQLYPVTYRFSISGFLLKEIRPTEQELEAIKQTFPHPYSDTSYVMTKEEECNNACSILNDDPSLGLNVRHLLSIAEKCIQLSDGASPAPKKAEEEDEKKGEEDEKKGEEDEKKGEEDEKKDEEEEEKKGEEEEKKDEEEDEKKGEEEEKKDEEEEKKEEIKMREFIKKRELTHAFQTMTTQNPIATNSDNAQKRLQNIIKGSSLNAAIRNWAVADYEKQKAKSNKKRLNQKRKERRSKGHFATRTEKEQENNIHEFTSALNREKDAEDVEEVKAKAVEDEVKKIEKKIRDTQSTYKTDSE
jgi:broad specificity phosphatase PhoE